jgi:lysophospholipase L1-like esterase
MTAIRIDRLTAGSRPAGRVVACLGDSITQGQLSANWVDQLQREHPGDGLTFVNAGVNGDLAWNVRQRLDPVVSLRPDVAVLLIGTNDITVAAGPPSLGWYEEDVAGILDRLRQETSARIAAIEIPPAGEDLSSARNQQTMLYNAALHRLAAQRAVPVLPLFSRLAALLPGAHGNGLTIFTDGLHLNDRAGAVVAELVGAFLAEQVPS